MRKTPLTGQQVAQCKKLFALRKQLGLSQPELARALGPYTDLESCSRGRLANWEYLKAPVPAGIWKKLPMIFEKALGAKKAELAAAVVVLCEISKRWNAESESPKESREYKRKAHIP
jgi:DNA-binding transcriptional regulator YiaG